MNRRQKEEFISSFHSDIKESQAFTLMSFSKLTVEDVTDFRKSLRKSDISVKVVKNTLAKRALVGTDFEAVCDKLTGTTMVAYGSGDPVATLKSIWEWAEKKEFNVEVKGGAALGEVMGVDQLTALSKLPGKKELFVSFLFALKHHPTNFLYALKDGPTSLLYALQSLKDKKETTG